MQTLSFIDRVQCDEKKRNGSKAYLNALPPSQFSEQPRCSVERSDRSQLTTTRVEEEDLEEADAAWAGGHYV
ncbi:hypothetical protein HJFPF1_12409 [Paramyrothecium foliicola]|nr:hypothetical protein HJFPF1_12409 [Paramyrothecium foliicola]